MKIRTNRWMSVGMVLATCAFGSTAWAKDAIASAVSGPFTPSTPIVAVNGNPYSSGTYAVGTIQLFYSVNAYQFTAGTFGAFQLNLQDLHVNNTGQTPAYPVTLNLTQTGSSNLVLTPTTSSFSVTGTSPQWSDSTTVTISIPAAVPNNPSLNIDGAELVANLQLGTAPQGSHLDTVTSIQVHIKLVHPTSCLRVFNYLTDQSLASVTLPLGVKLFAHGPNAGRTQITTPPQLSDDVLVVNTCPYPLSFDLSITLDPNFQNSTNPNGNSIFVMTKTDASTPPNLTGFLIGIPKGSNSCIAGLTLAGGDTLLGKVHMKIGDVLGSALPGSGNFSFSGSVSVAGSGCPGTLNTLATPNPVTMQVPFTIVP
ncbi:MAG: hypothetical protein ABJF23_28855 [Bryobacteraceae bacterium]